MRGRFISSVGRALAAATRPARSSHFSSGEARALLVATTCRGNVALSSISHCFEPGHDTAHSGWLLSAFLPFAGAMCAVQDPSVEAAELERTFIAIKPDGVQRGLISEIISRFERKGYKLVAVKLVVPTKEFAMQHYDDLKGRPFFNGLCDFLSSGPVLAMVWEGQGVIKYGRKLIGATAPQNSEPGTIRGDLAISVGRNIIHGSDGPETAVAEIALWFKPEELLSYSKVTDKWLYE
ncbi:hypothetical protein O6H91_08G044200 [Diphasiastrum complanatum]|uniref:Uncharacterized protein n=1 Tax=Diphasiastrum complanatum TaxID=34168 RepID=A0ACC2CX64_DIPCM|nr:hypothetical protein O6H91_08G044200 [Diphasiastrum complanatum]